MCEEMKEFAQQLEVWERARILLLNIGDAINLPVPIKRGYPTIFDSMASIVAGQDSAR
jgi:hypothetical protein